MYVSKHRIFLTEGKQDAVLETDPKAAFLLVGVGGSVNDDVAARYNLYKFDEPEQTDSAAIGNAEENQVEEKQVGQPPEAKIIDEPEQTRHVNMKRTK